MPHLQAHMADPSGSAVSGHALTASACLISQSQSAVSPPSSWPTSHAEVDRLFYLSSKLNLCGELTPIEAWDRIWSHPSAGRLTAEGFCILEQDLKGLITCYGYVRSILAAPYSVHLFFLTNHLSFTTFTPPGGRSPLLSRKLVAGIYASVFYFNPFFNWGYY
jgi:hypothetical protein